MKAEAHKTETKAGKEPPVTVDETALLKPNEAEETERLRRELEAERDSRLRLAAEFENYRRRTRREMDAASEKGKRELLERLISLADDFDLALANLNDDGDDPVAEGLRMIHKRFQAVLEAEEVTAFDSVGETFDPEVHEAFDVVTADDGEAGKVRSEIRRGYFWRGRLLRPALVTVAQ
jgi:Molecular chaperone GrpE (heat shock protein)